MLKKFLSLMLSAVLCASLLAAAFAEEASGEKVLYYPDFMAESEGETLVLEQEPQRIACLSNAALQVLVRCGITPVVITSLSASAEFPEWVYELPTVTVGVNGMDIETIFAYEPDLVIVGSYQKETYGQQFADAGIPVYYTSEGPSINYEQTKQTAIALARSFGTAEMAAEIEAEFAAVEERAAQFTASHQRMRMMIFFSEPGAYQQTSSGYLGSMLAMLPFDNLSDTVTDPAGGTVPMDAETAITLNPEIIFAISPTAATGEDLRAIFEEDFAANPAWQQIDAVKNGNVVYLSKEFVTTKGLQVVDSFNELMDMLEGAVPAAETAQTAQTAAITLEYPANMQEKGYTEPLTLTSAPQRVVCMSSTPVLALHEMGVPMVAIPASSVVDWPEDLAACAQQLQLSHNTNFDIETVVALEPDLVILGYTSQETYGAVLEGAGIPVYYVDAGHTVSYDSILAQTQALVDAFGVGTEVGADILQRFADLEARLEEARAQLAGKTVMVLQSAPPSHYIQTNGGTLGSMAEMLGLTNVYENDASSMAQLDYETALSYDPDLVLCVGMSKTGEEHRALMEEDFANNPDYWNSIPAIAAGDVIYLPVSYISSAGINVVDNINALADIVLNHFAQ